MEEKPTLYVCHGEKQGPRFHPCRKVLEAFEESGVEFEKVVGGKGSPLPWSKPPRERVIADTGQDSLPALRLADGTVITPSRQILSWLEDRRATQ
ncbi:MAG: Glutathione S-transferase, N-terminal domain [Solirubrobacteraceae bacterium]|jgi:glutathione S-transferase|nr:Glutathione S-transferase, N-terminal domain [Solirubrobacteraceae bacterium]